MYNYSKDGLLYDWRFINRRHSDPAAGLVGGVLAVLINTVIVTFFLSAMKRQRP